MTSSDPVFKSIDTTPSEAKYRTHYYCDFVELLALVSARDDYVTVSSVYERFYDSDDEHEDVVGTEMFAPEDDSRHSMINNWFSLLRLREARYLDLYPFEFLNDHSIRLKHELTHKNREYLFLLMTSLLSYSNISPTLTSFFEAVSEEALKQYLPSFSRCHLFGKSKNDNGRYTGSLKNKIDRLATDIHRKTVYQPAIFPSSNSGDAGLDVVAWVPFEGDGCYENIQLYLCQSAAGKNWLEKQDSVSRIGNYIHLPRATHNIIFIPYDARNESDGFVEQVQITADIVFDRYRIICLTSETILDYEQFIELSKIIYQAVSFEEPII